MLTQINIKRVNGTVTFETVSINNTDNVFFTNLDTDPDPAKSTHWPDICDDELAPSPHCHILAHEDRGMMQLVRVVPAVNYPQKCQDSVPAHH